MGSERESVETHDYGREGLPPIRVLTYNMKGGEGAHNRWQGRERDYLDLQKIADVIRRHSPDIVSLQEIALIGTGGRVADQVAYLAESLGMAHAFAPVEGSSHLRRGGNPQRDYWGNAVLSRFPIVDFRVHELCSGRPRECRSLLETHLLVGSQVVIFAAVHFSFLWRTTFEQSREAVSLLSRSDLPVIVAGDFNACAGSAELSPLHSAFADAFSLTGVPFSDPRRFSFPNGPAAERDLDHIFVSPGFGVRSCRVVVDDEGVSDHNPLFAEVSLPVGGAVRLPRLDEMADDLLG